MSNMLGRSNPWAFHCCARHSGRLNMTPKRMKEDRDWRREAEQERSEKD